MYTRTHAHARTRTHARTHARAHTALTDDSGANVDDDERQETCEDTVGNLNVHTCVSTNHAHMLASRIFPGLHTKVQNAGGE